MRSLLMTLLRLLLLLTTLPGPSLAVITNRTIDDTRGDSVTANPVVYQGLWNATACPQCLIQPDPAQAFDGTWTETTYFQQSQDPINVTLTFTGTAIYVFFILANNAGAGVISKTMANITLDNQSPLLYEHIPGVSSSDLQYNALVFSRSDLENVHHSLVISVSGIQEEVYLNFDYAIYTHEDQVFEASGESVPDPTKQPQIPHSSGRPGPSPISFSSAAPASRTFSTPLGVHIRSSVSSVSTSQSISQVSAPSASVPASGFESSTPSISPSSISTDTGGPATPSQTPSAQPTLQRGKSQATVGVIVGGCLGSLVILSFLIFGIVFIWTKRLQRRSGSRLSSVHLLNNEDGNSGSRIHTGNGNINEDGIDTTIVPFQLGPPYTSQLENTGIKPSEATVMTTRQEILPATVTSQTTRTMSESEVARANSGRRMEGLRRARQEELDQHLQVMQQEMVEVLNEINNRRVSNQMLWLLPVPGQPDQSITATNHSRRGSADGQMSIDELQDALRHMRLQIEYLQQQQQSAWAQGLSDNPPPGYTTDTRA